MAQSTDIILSDQLGAPFRAELNQILSALGTNNSGNSEPLNTYQFMKWVDTSNATYYYIKERNHDNTAWVTLFRYTVATKIIEAVSDEVTIEHSKIVAKDSPTGSAMMPAGTTAERTALPSNGNLRYNNDLSKFEGYQGGVWSTLGGLDINTLTAKATPIDADEMVLADSTSSFSLKKFTLSNLKTVLDETWIANDTRAKTALNASGTAPIYACRAWVNFNGTGTVAIRASGNVSSITDNGTGDYTVNFITAMPDVNYSFFVEGIRIVEPSNIKIPNLSYIATTSFRFQTLNEGSNTAIDHDVITQSVFR